MSKRSISGIVVILVPLTIILAVLGGIYYMFQQNSRTASLYLVPQGYVGMVSVQFGQAGTAPVPEEGEYLVFRIPDSGVLKTATPEPEYGKAADKYYYVDQKGTRTEIEPTVGIHGGSIGGKEGAPPTLSFFVGSQAEWEKFKQQQTNK